MWLEPGVCAECGRSPGTVWKKCVDPVVVWKKILEARKPEVVLKKSVEGAQILCGRRVWREPRVCVKECGGSPEIVWTKSVEGAQRLCGRRVWREPRDCVEEEY